jgi:Mg2+-importing ATPase
MRAYINSYFETGIKSPLDQAILEHAQPDITGWTKLDEVPFDFERRRVSVLVESQGRRFLIIKGAPEDIIKLSSHYETAAGTVENFDKSHAACAKMFEDLGGQGLRVLAVAFKEVDASHQTASLKDEAGLTFSGFLTFMDPPKKSAAEALRKLAAAGVGVKIISGDNERVTRHVCEMIGFEAGDILTGETMAGLSDGALLARVESTTVFCRVNPQQKNQIIAALKERGHSVGFLGDGINDAAALHGADIGISVDSGADVAKAAADVILMEQDLSVIHAGVLEGRRAVENSEKYILMDSSSNFGNMFSMAGAALILPFLPMLPTQILLNNLLYDFSQTVLPFDNVDEEALERAVHWDIKRIRHFMWVLGPVSSLFDFLTFYVLLKMFPDNKVLFHTGWFVESLVTQVLIVFAIRTHKFILHSRPHKYIVFMASGVAALGIALPFTPLGAWFGFAPLPGLFFAFLAVAVTAYFVLVEVAKHVFRRII